MHGRDLPGGTDHCSGHLHIQVGGNEHNELPTETVINVIVNDIRHYSVFRERVSEALKQGIHSSMEEYGKVKDDQHHNSFQYVNHAQFEMIAIDSIFVQILNGKIHITTLMLGRGPRLFCTHKLEWLYKLE